MQDNTLTGHKKLTTDSWNEMKKYSPEMRYDIDKTMESEVQRE